MKVEIELPQRDEPWTTQTQAGFVVICVNIALAYVKLTDQHEVTVTAKR